MKVFRKDYKSPSQINAFIERRDQYIRNYVMGDKWKGNSSFGRGQAIEHGLDMAIQGSDHNVAAAHACEFYKNYCAENNLSKEEAAKITEEEIVECTLAICLYYIKELGATEAVKAQTKVKWEDEMLSQPIIGYADYIFPSTPFNKGAVRDLKTAAKTPSKLSPGYKLQGTVYHMATGSQVFFDYVIKLKKEAKVVTIGLTQEDIAEYVPIIIAASKAMDNLWEIIPEELTEDHMGAFSAIGFPNVHGEWNQDARNEMIRNLKKWT